MILTMSSTKRIVLRNKSPRILLNLKKPRGHERGVNQEIEKDQGAIVDQIHLGGPGASRSHPKNKLRRKIQRAKVELT